MKRCTAKTLKEERCLRNASEDCDGKCKQHSSVGTRRGVSRSPSRSKKDSDESPKLIKIEKATDGVHKYVATFEVNGRERHTPFGAAKNAKGEPYTDFTIHKDYDHRDLYIQRHKKDLNTRDFTRAGSLSMYILWNYPSFSQSVKDFKRRIKENDFSLPKGYKR
jgi:hypothetical protein